MRIGRAPRGFFDLFSVQNQGVAPQDLADTIVPVVDIRDQFLASETRNNLDTTTSATVAGFYAVYQVPANTTLVMFSCSAFLVMEAGKTAKLTIGCELNAAVQGAMGPTVLAAAAATTRTFWTPGNTVTFPPGAKLGAFIDDITAGPLTVATQLGFSSLCALIRAGV